MLANILAQLGVSEEESNLYSLLLATGPIQAGKLATRAGIPRSSLYGFLDKLAQRRLVNQSLKDGVKVFAAQDPATVIHLFQQQIDLLKTAQDKYKQILPNLLARDSAKLITPRFQMYEGGEGLKNVLQDMLLYSDIETVALWPIKAMVEALTPQFFRYLNKERIKSRLYTRAIWPANQVLNTIDHPYLGSGSGFYREIRVAPKTMRFAMGYWVYADKAAFLSSKRESFGFIIQSQELVDLLRSQFEILWQLSVPLTTNEDSTKEFLDEIDRTS
jgi:HTH-type transcriptional regulator, sugar sensing transcriptional regulator